MNRIWIQIPHPEGRRLERPVRHNAARILAAMGLSDAELSVVLTDDAGISALNREYLGRCGPTNVMAFPMREGDAAHVAPHLLGDVVISLDTARLEARQGGVDLESHLARLLVHGILHLVGYDHEAAGAEAERMEAEEDRLMECLGISLRERYRE